MKRLRYALLLLAVCALTAGGLVTAAMGAAAEDETSSAPETKFEVTKAGPGEEGPRFTFAFHGIDAQHALRTVFEAAGEPYAWGGRLEDHPVTVSVTNAKLQTAVDLICRLAGLMYVRQEGVWVISERPDTVRIGGREVPVLGAIRTEGSFADAEALAYPMRDLAQIERTLRRAKIADLESELGEHELREALGLPARSRGGGGGGRGLAELPELPSCVADVLVDLTVEDATMAEVAEKLTAAVDAGVELLLKEPGDAHVLEIRAHKAIPQDLRITARIYRMPLRDVMQMLIQQTNLVCRLESVGKGWEWRSGSPRPQRAPGMSDEEWLHRVTGGSGAQQVPLQVLHIVPQPELSVSGPRLGPPPSRTEGIGGGGLGTGGSAAAGER